MSDDQEKQLPVDSREMLTRHECDLMLSPDHAFGISYIGGNVHFNLGAYFFNTETSNLEIKNIAHVRMGINEFANIHHWMGEQLKALEEKGAIAPVGKPGEQDD